MYKIDLLRQIEANTRGGALSDCYFAPDLWRMIERNTRVPFMPTKNWRVNYTKEGYVEVPEWEGVLGDVVELTFNTTFGGFLFDGVDSTGSSRGYLSIHVITKRWEIPSSATVTIDGVVTNSGDSAQGFLDGRPHKVIYSLGETMNIYLVGIIQSLSPHGSWCGSITNIKLTKADGSDNRYYESIIKSDTKPTTLILVDALSSVRAETEFINASTYPSHYAPITKNRLQWENGSTDGKLINFPSGKEWTEILND